MAALLRKYGIETKVHIPLIDFGATDLLTSDPGSWAAADLQISKDEGAFNNTSNTPVWEGRGIVSVTLTAAEMQAARVTLSLVDQTGTKEYEDQIVLIETYGDASSQHETFNANMTHINGSATNGNNATLSLKKLDLHNDAGIALDVESDSASATRFRSLGGNGHGLLLDADGTGSGLYAYGGEGAGIHAEGGTANADGIKAIGKGTGKDINATEIDDVQTTADDIETAVGTPVALDGGAATIAAMLVKMADDNGGADFDATTDSLEKIASSVSTVIKLDSLVDGKTVSAILEKIMAMADGRFALNTPTAGEVTFYKRDNSTPLFIVEVTSIGRIRSLG